jgi:hypothetical protein
MIIQDSKNIKEIQTEFHQIFPGLKIVFYQVGHDDHEGSEKGMEYTGEHKLYEIRQGHAEGVIEIKPEMSVQQLEQGFEELFGLHVQIFRKSGTVWLQTINTDDWSLKKQNEKGMETVHD